MLPEKKPYEPGKQLDENSELELLTQILKSEPGKSRHDLIRQLAAVSNPRRAFHEYWLLLHTPNDIYSGWTEEGYDPDLASVPYEVQILSAVKYGKADIDNGLLHQSFSNGTGIFAPEMADWFEANDYSKTARVLRDAIAVFGSPFPRSQHARQSILDGFEGSERKEWDPFYLLDPQFYESLSDDDKFKETAENWLRNKCDVNSLLDKCRSNQQRLSGN